MPVVEVRQAWAGWLVVKIEPFTEPASNTTIRRSSFGRKPFDDCLATWMML